MPRLLVLLADAASSRGYDVVVVGDGVATATANQQTALTILGATVANVISTSDIVSYMKNDYVEGKPGAVKGKETPDGRKQPYSPPV